MQKNRSQTWSRQNRPRGRDSDATISRQQGRSQSTRGRKREKSGRRKNTGGDRRKRRKISRKRSRRRRWKREESRRRGTKRKRRGKRRNEGSREGGRNLQRTQKDRIATLMTTLKIMKERRKMMIAYTKEWSNLKVIKKKEKKRKKKGSGQFPIRNRQA